MKLLNIMSEDNIESSCSLEFSFPKCPSEKGRFINPYQQKLRKGLKDFLLWRLGYFKDRHPKVLAPEIFEYPNPRKVTDDKPKVTWVNHSSFLVSYKSFHLLTDPIWSHRCSPTKLVGPKRLHQPPIALSEMKHLSLVLISHNHFDHLDKPTILEIFKLNPNVLFVVPKGVKRWFFRNGIQNVIELEWWQTKFVQFKLDEHVSVEITAVPSQHFSGRGVFDKNKTLWCGYVLRIYEEGRLVKTMYFVGDTGYNPP